MIINSKTIKVLGLINARGGSKGIPGKNKKLLCGKPLIAYSIETANCSDYLDKVVVSTDDMEIFDISKECGAEVPFVRPDRLAGDEIKQHDVIVHALDELEKLGDIYDIVTLLQPTAPLRKVEDIDGCIGMLLEGGFNSVASFTPMKGIHPYYMYTLEDKVPHPIVSPDLATGQRQSFPKIYYRNGAIYAFRREAISKGNNYEIMGAYIMPEERSVNIDSMDDWDRAEEIIQHLDMRFYNDD